MRELHDSQPAVLERMTKSIPSMLPKAYRWVGEMDEISAFVRDGLGEGEAHVHHGFAQLYARIEKDLPDGEDVRVSLLARVCCLGFSEGALLRDR